MKTLIVCGDSWMSPLLDNNGQSSERVHFAEILADKYNYDLQVFSMPGIGNHGISWQLQSAVKCKPDLIIFNTTTTNRPVVKVAACPDNLSYPHEHRVLDLFHYNRENIKKFIKEEARSPFFLCGGSIEERIKNSNHSFSYYYNCLNTKEEKEYFFNNLDKIKEPFMGWFSYMNDNHIAKDESDALMYKAMHQLHESKIPYVMMMDALELQDECSWINETNNIIPWLPTIKYFDEKYSKKDKENLYPFHTNKQDQIDYFFTTLENHLLKYNYIL